MFSEKYHIKNLIGMDTRVEVTCPKHGLQHVWVSNASPDYIPPCELCEAELNTQNQSRMYAINRNERTANCERSLIEKLRNYGANYIATGTIPKCKKELDELVSNNSLLPVVIGKKGTGKTTALCYFVKQFCILNSSQDFCYTSEGGLLRKIKGCYNTGSSEEQLFNNLVSFDLLAIDDMSIESDPRVVKFINQILKARLDKELTTVLAFTIQESVNLSLRLEDFKGLIEKTTIAL